MNNNFDNAFNKTMKWEGWDNISNNKNDSGGLTKFGISQKAYPNLDIKNLTIHQARKIYWQDYWKKFNCHLINDPEIAAKCFDMVVNMGRNGVKILQRAVKDCGKTIKVDGVNGPNTIKTVNSIEPSQLIVAIRAEQGAFYRLLVARNSKYKVFIKGWLRRALA